jgi:hypothetical protein
MLIVADVVTPDEHSSREAEATDRFELTSSDDISEGVLRARALAVSQLQTLRLSGPDAEWVGAAAAVPGSPLFEAIRSGELSYRVSRWRLRS